MHKADYSYTDKLNELRLDITHPNSFGKIFVFLEGDSDVRLYRKLFDASAVKIEVIPGGKFKLEEGLAELLKLYNLIFSIRDADFIHYNKVKFEVPNMFLTDYHDLEISLIVSDETFLAIGFEFLGGDRDENIQLREKLLSALKFASYLKLHNDTNNLELNFQGVNFGDVYDVNSNSFDRDKFVQKIVLRSPRAKEKNEREILDSVLQLEKEYDDSLQLVNGHDFMKILALYITEKSGRGVSSETIASHFRISYTFKNFQTTTLYKDTKAWADALTVKIYPD